MLCIQFITVAQLVENITNKVVRYSQKDPYLVQNLLQLVFECVQTHAYDDDACILLVNQAYPL
jgi:hypothetical protein